MKRKSRNVDDTGVCQCEEGSECKHGCDNRANAIECDPERCWPTCANNAVLYKRWQIDLKFEAKVVRSMAVR